ncbi:DUF3791 domain-containing protein [Anaerovoracaceae bacterium 41-7]|jgi:hypothetical protein|uniref:DUF3791 domain-containing protein n=1 Tax=Anaerotruncus colihominis TaxID=169435 RepID=A0A845QJF3_9FIRM|nr:MULTISPECIES: DUF3791 domain-containing protein [Clostridia]MCI9475505.1 DUF3791 domain-containing protein [Emergencia sp.]NBH61155.1 DUF3791 domain-containing protein [Anaerotruncus colihominis]NCE98965.1 DUF3791 domain-containing protein [Emergencia sp. 1XD21-10]NCF01810.1 DUF3791 domain-containing protein [Anaerotruncus sp. 80]
MASREKEHDISQEELEFAVFCVENLEKKLSVGSQRIFKAFTEDSDILYSYIIPNYPILHTQSKEYILEDILSLLNEKGIKI